MKAGLISIAALSAVAAAIPHAGHRHRHEKKDVAVDYVTEVSYATATAQGPVVYVDSNGNPISTSYPADAAVTTATINGQEVSWGGNNAPATTETAAPAYSAPPAYTAPAPAPSSETSEAAPAYTAPASSAPAYTPPASSSSAAAPAPSSGSSSGHGITYSPYTSSGGCKDTAAVNKDFESINGYSFVRIYGTDCNQVANVISAAKSKGMKVFAGIYDITSVESQAQTIIDAAKDNWDIIDTVSVGNEGINAGTYTIPQIKSAVASAKSCLGAAGYSGPVVTVDTFVAIIANPELCEVGDYVAANCHAFFDGGVTAEEAGKFVLSQTQRVSQACNGKKTVITETGWPSSGSSNKLAVPSTSNQQAAVDSIKATFSDNVYLFTAFNDFWKQNNAGTFGAEQYWGIYGNCPSE